MRERLSADEYEFCDTQHNKRPMGRGWEYIGATTNVVNEQWASVWFWARRKDTNPMEEAAEDERVACAQLARDWAERAAENARNAAAAIPPMSKITQQTAYERLEGALRDLATFIESRG